MLKLKDHGRRLSYLIGLVLMKQVAFVLYVAFVFFLFNRELLNLLDLGFKYWYS